MFEVQAAKTAPQNAPKKPPHSPQRHQISPREVGKGTLTPATMKLMKKLNVHRSGGTAGDVINSDKPATCVRESKEQRSGEHYGLNSIDESSVLRPSALRKLSLDASSPPPPPPIMPNSAWQQNTTQKASKRVEFSTTSVVSTDAPVYDRRRTVINDGSQPDTSSIVRPSELFGARKQRAPAPLPQHNVTVPVIHSQPMRQQPKCAQPLVKRHSYHMTTTESDVVFDYRSVLRSTAERQQNISESQMTTSRRLSSSKMETETVRTEINTGLYDFFAVIYSLFL